MASFMDRAATSPFGFGDALTVEPRARHAIVTPDGLTLAAQEWGNPDGPPVLFLHAFGMTHVAWLKQLTGSLAKTHRLVTFEHRGHGASDKPADPAAYADGARFGDDIDAVIRALKLDAPAVVAWSMSGALLGDYLAKYGAANTSRIVLIGAVNALGQTMMSTGQLGAKFADPRANWIHDPDFRKQWLGFAHVNDGLTSRPMDADAWAIVQAGSMLVPVPARGAILMRDADHLGAYTSAAVPILQIHAEDDPIVSIAAADRLRAARPDVERLHLKDGAHAPHWERGDEVNAALARFIPPPNV